MNERIKELALRAGGEFWQRLENDAVKQDAYITFDPPDSLEKFAEFIVKECAGIYSKIDNGNLHMGSDDYLEALQKHFRVEE
jgi:hypothetical protein